MSIPFTTIKQKEALPDGSSLVLFSTEDVMGRITQEEYARNLYRITASGSVLWRVIQTTKEYPQCFENFRFEKNGKLIAYNFDCWEYEVDVESGAIKRHAFLK